MRHETKEKFEAMAVDFGLPVHWLNFAGGWLMGCNACTTAGRIVRLYEQGKISRDEHKKLFLAVANAKTQNDNTALFELRGKLEELRKASL
jgi:hypothetical protein